MATPPNKDKLAEAMAKVKFDAPRGPFRFDPVTHNPIQNVYFVRGAAAGRPHRRQGHRHAQGRAGAAHQERLIPRRRSTP